MRVLLILFVLLPSLAFASNLEPKIYSRAIDLSLECLSKSTPHDPHLGDVSAYRSRHPAFYGCYDWHASVINYWILVHQLNVDSNFSQRDAVIKQLNQALTLANIKIENQNLGEVPIISSFESAWLLRLAVELRMAKVPEASEWVRAITPLEKSARNLFFENLKAQEVAEFFGDHTNTAFSLINAFDYSLFANDTAMQAIIRAKALRWYTEIHNCLYQDDGHFAAWIPSCMTQAEIMGKVLDRPSFVNWITPLVPVLIEQGNTIVPPFGKYPGYKVGLMLTKTSSLRSIADVLGKASDVGSQLLYAADQQESSAGPTVFDYGYDFGNHWLPAYLLRAREL